MATHRTILFCGAGGIGMSGLAQLLHDRGDTIIGTDRVESPITELLRLKGIEIRVPQHAENVTDQIDLVVYSAAVGEENPERQRARELGIPEQTYFEALGSLSSARRTVAVAGTHGKTTTTGMLAKLLLDAGVSPSAIVGSVVQDFGSNYLKGSSDLFVVEACEFQRHFLELSPEVLIVTNIEFDHTDYYQDLGDVQKAFRSFMEKVPEHGAIITDTEHPHIAPLLEGLAAPVLNYASEPAYSLLLPGEFNQANARAAARAVRHIAPQFAEAQIAHSLGAFRGTWRRFEEKGTTTSGVVVYDDYAHHPSAIKETLRALKAKTSGRVFVAFHPHLYSRTRDLLDGFARAFGDADEVLVAPIYAAREVDDGSVSSELLAERISAEGKRARAATFEEIETILRSEPVPGDTIMTMGAGNIYQVADRLVRR